MLVFFSFLLVVLTISGCSQEYQEATITIEDFRFTPSQLHLFPDQPIRLTVRNQGREIHRFKSQVLPHSMINGKTDELHADSKHGLAIPPGKSLELTLTLSAGVYDFRCPIRGHRGMRGMFFIEEAGREASFFEGVFATCRYCAEFKETWTLPFQAQLSISENSANFQGQP